MALDDSRFAALADETLRRILEAVDASGGDLDADLRDGVLTIEAGSGAQYVVNQHAPNREIWVSSPVSGAWHFAFDEGRGQWIDTRATDKASALPLSEPLARELGELGGVAITLS
jgi:frataxin